MISAGTKCYRLGVVPCTGIGLSWNNKELEEAINGQVATVIFDYQGVASIREHLADVAETDFEKERLAEILATNLEEIESWRVGEAIAETYLTEHRNCTFPWAAVRDQRKSRSSLPGADLVGFQQDGDSYRFAFGEVKTSEDTKYPPGVVYGQTGLKRQLKDLRDRVHIRNNLLKYLGHRANAAPWQNQFKVAGKRYLANQSDFQLFGFLVRDVIPGKKDLIAQVEKLGDRCPVCTRIEFLALYLPAGAIENLPSRIRATKSGGSV